MKKKYDSIIIGAGPAGLSAAIYLARFKRSVLVLDKGEGRSTYPQINENYLGFPDGIPARELRNRGRQQAKKFGAIFIADEVCDIKGKLGNFTVTGKKEYYGSTILLATGVTDIFPIFEDYEAYIGKTMFWCITCDGYKTIKKTIVVVGNDDEAAVTCMQFLNYTSKITMVTNAEQGATNISPQVKRNLTKKNIPLLETRLVNVAGKNGVMTSVSLENGKTLELDYLFSQLGSNPNCSLAALLQVKMNAQGFISVDQHQRTSVRGVYAAGDVTRHHSHQVVAAAHEGSIAAEALNYDIYNSYQKSP